MAPSVVFVDEQHQSRGPIGLGRMDGVVYKSPDGTIVSADAATESDNLLGSYFAHLDTDDQSSVLGALGSILGFTTAQERAVLGIEAFESVNLGSVPMGSLGHSGPSLSLFNLLVALITYLAAFVALGHYVYGRIRRDVSAEKQVDEQTTAKFAQRVAPRMLIIALGILSPVVFYITASGGQIIWVNIWSIWFAILIASFAALIIQRITRNDDFKLFKKDAEEKPAADTL
jgi:hypothetical protein